MSRMIQVDTGWVVLRHDGGRVGLCVHPTKEAAEVVAESFDGGRVAPAKRVWSSCRKRPDWIIGEAA